MLKLERLSDGERIIIRLIGRVQSKHLGEIANQMGSCGSNVTLDLEEVTVVCVEVVRFLGSCEKKGTELLHCPTYIREWISCEARLSGKNSYCGTRNGRVHAAGRSDHYHARQQCRQRLRCAAAECRY